MGDRTSTITMTTIAEVLTRLESMIEWARQQESPMGYFPALYYQMTLAVKEGIDRDLFENGTRMERLDVLFAKRYISAFDAWQAGEPVTRSWQLAFDATRDERLTVMQHLLLGINAHINLDLGIAAAQTRPKDAVFGLRKDFETINSIIAGLTDRVQDCLAGIWMPFSWLDWLLRTDDEGWINFSIGTARGASWRVATTLAFAPDMATEKILIGQLDGAIAFLGNKVKGPGFLLKQGLWMMRCCEKGTVREKIDLLMETAAGKTQRNDGPNN